MNTQKYKISEHHIFKLYSVLSFFFRALNTLNNEKIIRKYSVLALNIRTQNSSDKRMKVKTTKDNHKGIRNFSRKSLFNYQRSVHYLSVLSLYILRLEYAKEGAVDNYHFSPKRGLKSPYSTKTRIAQ